MLQCRLHISHYKIWLFLANAPLWLQLNHVLFIRSEPLLAFACRTSVSCTLYLKILQIGIHPLWLNIKEETRKDVRDKQSFLEWLWCLQQIIKSKVAWKPKTCWEWIGSFLLHPTCNLMSGNNSVTLMNISKFLNCVNFSCPHFHFVLFCFNFLLE